MRAVSQTLPQCKRAGVRLQRFVDVTEVSVHRPEVLEHVRLELGVPAGRDLIADVTERVDGFGQIALFRGVRGEVLPYVELVTPVAAAQEQRRRLVPRWLRASEIAARIMRI